MHVPTHLLSGWCIASLFELTPRERLLCMLAASAEDLDGLGAVMGTQSDAYQNYHHVVCHNLLYVTIVAVAFALVSRHRFKAFLLYMTLGHLHLLMDLFGSGPGWGIAYWFPFSRRVYRTDLAWEFFSWQNITSAGVLLAWVIVIVIRQGRTPIEMIAPDLDRRFVMRLKRKKPDETTKTRSHEEVLE